MSAEEYRLHLVGDAFINGLASSQIRQRLLECNEITVSEGFNKTMPLYQAEEYFASYTTRSHLITASIAQDKSGDLNLIPSNDLRAIASIGGKMCYFCGRLHIIDVLIVRQEKLRPLIVGKQGIFLASTKQRLRDSIKTTRRDQ